MKVLAIRVQDLQEKENDLNMSVVGWRHELHLSIDPFAAQKLGIIHSAMIVGTVCFVLAFIALWRLQETFGKDLNYVE